MSKMHMLRLLSVGLLACLISSKVSAMDGNPLTQSMFLPLESLENNSNNQEADKQQLQEPLLTEQQEEASATSSDEELDDKSSHDTESVSSAQSTGSGSSWVASSEESEETKKFWDKTLGRKDVSSSEESDSGGGVAKRAIAADGTELQEQDGTTLEVNVSLQAEAESEQQTNQAPIAPVEDVQQSEEKTEILQEELPTLEVPVVIDNQQEQQAISAATNEVPASEEEINIAPADASLNEQVVEEEKHDPEITADISQQPSAPVASDQEVQADTQKEEQQINEQQQEVIVNQTSEQEKQSENVENNTAVADNNQTTVTADVSSDQQQESASQEQPSSESANATVPTDEKQETTVVNATSEVVDVPSDKQESVTPQMPVPSDNQMSVSNDGDSLKKLPVLGNAKLQIDGQQESKVKDLLGKLGLDKEQAAQTEYKAVIDALLAKLQAHQNTISDVSLKKAVAALITLAQSLETCDESYAAQATDQLLSLGDLLDQLNASNVPQPQPSVGFFRSMMGKLKTYWYVSVPAAAATAYVTWRFATLPDEAIMDGAMSSRDSDVLIPPVA